MQDYDHIIMRLVLAVNTPPRKQYLNIQHTIEQAFKQKLKPLIDQILSHYTPDDVVIKIDTLTLDIGNLSLEEVEKQLAQRITQHLHPIAKAAIEKRIHSAAKEHITPLPQAQHKAIQHYLTQGYFAWWMPNHTPQSIETHYLSLLNQPNKVWTPFWDHIAQNPKAIHRLVTHFTPTTLQKTIQRLTPKHSKTIINLATDLSTIQEKNRWIATLRNTFEHAKWEAIFSQPKQPHQYEFNTLSFIQVILEALAKKFQTTYPSLLLTLTKHLKATSLQSNLKPSVILLQEAHINPIQKSTATTPIERLKQLLIQYQQPKPQSIILLLEEILSTPLSPHKRTLLTQWLQDKKIHQKLLSHLTPSHLSQLIKTLQPNLLATFTQVTQLWGEFIAPTQTPSSTTPTITLPALTLDYITNPSKKPTPPSYLHYLLHQLPQYTTLSLKKLKNLPQHTTISLTTTLQHLNKTVKAKGYDQRTTKSVTKIILTHLFQHIAQKNGYQQPFDELLKSNPIAQLQAEVYLPSLPETLIHTETDTLITLSTLKTFLTQNKIPDNYDRPTFINTFIKAIQQEPLRQNMLKLLQQPNITKTISTQLSEPDRETLITALTPITPAIFNTYKRLLCSADILQPTTLPDKNQWLDQTFLDAITQIPQATQPQLIRLVFIKTAQQTRFPQKEIWRRINQASKKIQQSDPILQTIAPIIPSSDQKATQMATTLDEQLLNLYEAILQTIPPQATQKLYATLVLTIKQILTTPHITPQKKIANIIQQLTLTDLTRKQKQELTNTITKFVQTLVNQKTKHINIAWEHFLQTQQLIKDYTSPHTLLADFQQYATPQAKQLFKQLLQSHTIRETLLATFNDHALTQLIPLIEQKHHKKVTQYITTLLRLQHHTKTNFRNTWWHSTLTSLINTKKFHEEVWLLKSLSTLIRTLEAHTNTHTLALLAQEILPDTQQKNIILKLLHTISKEPLKKIQTQAKQLFPTQPLLRDFYRLLALGPIPFEAQTTQTQREHRLQNLSKSQVDSMKKVLLTLKPKITIAQRLTMHFSSTTIDCFIQYLEPKAYPFIRQCLDWLNPIIIKNFKHLQPTTWQYHSETATISYLLDNIEKSFQLQPFLIHILSYIAQQANTTLQQLIKPIIQQLPNNTHIKQNFLNIISNQQYTPHEESKPLQISHEKINIEPSKELTQDHKESIYDNQIHLQPIQQAFLTLQKITPFLPKQYQDYIPNAISYAWRNINLNEFQQNNFLQQVFTYIAQQNKLTLQQLLSPIIQQLPQKHEVNNFLQKIISHTETQIIAKTQGEKIITKAIDKSIETLNQNIQKTFITLQKISPFLPKQYQHYIPNAISYAWRNINLNEFQQSTFLQQVFIYIAQQEKLTLQQLLSPIIQQFPQKHEVNNFLQKIISHTETQIIAKTQGEKIITKAIDKSIETLNQNIQKTFITLQKISPFLPKQYQHYIPNAISYAWRNINLNEFQQNSFLQQVFTYIAQQNKLTLQQLLSPIIQQLPQKHEVNNFLQQVISRTIETHEIQRERSTTKSRETLTQHIQKAFITLQKITPFLPKQYQHYIPNAISYAWGNINLNDFQQSNFLQQVFTYIAQQEKLTLQQLLSPIIQQLPQKHEVNNFLQKIISHTETQIIAKTQGEKIITKAIDKSIETLNQNIQKTFITLQKISPFLPKQYQHYIPNAISYAWRNINLNEFQQNSFLQQVFTYIAQQEKLTLQQLLSPIIQQLPQKHEVNNFLQKIISHTETHEIQGGRSTTKSIETLNQNIQKTFITLQKISPFLPKQYQHYIPNAISYAWRSINLNEFQQNNFLQQVFTYIAQQNKLTLQQLLSPIIQQLPQKHEVNNFLQQVISRTIETHEIQRERSTTKSRETLTQHIQKAFITLQKITPFLPKQYQHYIPNAISYAWRNINLNEFQQNSFLQQVFTYIAQQNKLTLQQLLSPIIQQLPQKHEVNNFLQKIISHTETQIIAKTQGEKIITKAIDKSIETLNQNIQKTFITLQKIAPFLPKQYQHYIPNAISYAWRSINLNEFQQSTFLQQIFIYIAQQEKLTLKNLLTILAVHTGANQEMSSIIQALQQAREEKKIALQPIQEETTEAIKVYVENGGVIFLWPFFIQLFEEQGLIEESTFIDDIAINNAVHAIQYMVTEKLSTPEEALVLNKILCGLQQDDVITSHYMVREEVENSEDTTLTGNVKEQAQPNETSAKDEKEEEVEPLPAEIIRLQTLCEQALTLCMERWESLEELETYEAYKEGFTVEDFKGYILKRHCILQKIEGEEGDYWHLSLAVKGYDSKQIKPPWSIQKIQLPWMPLPLVVFWLPN